MYHKQESFVTTLTTVNFMEGGVRVLYREHSPSYGVNKGNQKVEILQLSMVTTYLQ